MVLEFSREDTAKQANIKIMLSIFQKQKAANLKKFAAVFNCVLQFVIMHLERLRQLDMHLRKYRSQHMHQHQLHTCHHLQR